jgi:hypothetical protein
MEKEILHIVTEEKNIVQTITQKKANGNHSLCRICLLNHITKEQIEGKGRRGRRRKKLVDNLRETRKY